MRLIEGYEMKYALQFSIILGVALFGELLRAIIPAPIPASVYGLVVLFICLLCGVVRISSIEETSKILLELLPLTLVPATVGIVDSLDALKSMAVPVVLLATIGTMIVGVAASGTAEGIIRFSKRGKK